MDPRLQRYYERELQHIRDVGGEFAKQYPKIAGRLGLEAFKCADPYVERLLEGFAFLAARVQLRIDAEHPRFTQQLLSMVLPQYLAPTPSMLVAQFWPEPTEAALADGLVIPRDTVLSTLAAEDDTPCKFGTGHEVTLWPLEVVDAKYFAYGKDVAALGVGLREGTRAAIRLRLRTTADLNFDQLALDQLPVYLRGTGEQPMHVYEQLLANAVGFLVRPATANPEWQEWFEADSIRRTGFDESQALLPRTPRSFEGYRLLREYFAFPERFRFVEFCGLQRAIRRCAGADLEILVLLDRSDELLDETLDGDNFALFCAPAINLFERRADRISIDGHSNEHHVLVDRTRPMDFEVYDVVRAIGVGGGDDVDQEFRPFYACYDRRDSSRERAYYTLRREPRQLSRSQRRGGSRSKYIGSETYLSLVDGNEAPYSSDLRQLSLRVLCTNRDLPLQVPVGQGASDFTLDVTLPLVGIKCVDGPTRPRESLADGDFAWRLINHLSLNYVSLVDSGDQGAEALREILRLYADEREPYVRAMIDDGVLSVGSKPITRRVPAPGPSAFGRGLEITLECDESGFEGSGVFLFGAVMDHFFSKYVTLNSFTETVVRTAERGEIVRWPARLGQRSVL